MIEAGPVFVMAMSALHVTVVVTVLLLASVAFVALALAWLETLGQGPVV